VIAEQHRDQSAERSSVFLDGDRFRDEDGGRLRPTCPADHRFPKSAASCSAGNLKIRAKSCHKAAGRTARARLVISPTIPRLARPAILLWIWRTLRSVDVASASISLIIRSGIAGRPKWGRCASAAGRGHGPAAQPEPERERRRHDGRRVDGRSCRAATSPHDSSAGSGRATRRIRPSASSGRAGPDGSAAAQVVSPHERRASLATPMTTAPERRVAPDHGDGRAARGRRSVARKGFFPRRRRGLGHKSIERRVG